MFAMFSRHLTLLLLLSWTFLSQCVTPPEQSRQSFLWEARRGDERLALLGTMHVGIRAEDMDPLLWQELKEADTVIIEADLTQVTPTHIQKYLLLSDGQSLETLLGPDYWARLIQILRRATPELKVAELRYLSPLAAGSRLLLAQARTETTDELEGDSIDHVIFSKAKAAGKQTKTFETLDEQFSVLKKVFTLEQLKEMIDSDEKETLTYKELKAAYKSGNSETLDKLMAEIPEDMRGILLDQRNRNWMRDLPRLRGKRTLIAVGAAHFPGEEGLLKLLQKEGYSIRTLASPDRP